MKAFVTGASGFLGQRLVSALLERGEEVVCLMRPSANSAALGELAKRYSGRLGVVTGTLGRSSDYIDALQGCTVLYHAAAAMKGATAVLFQNNVIATRELVTAAARAGVRRFVLVSSLGVYGSQSLRKGSILDESCPLDSKPYLRDPYTYSKHSQEIAAHGVSAEMGLPIVILRPGVIYGPGRDCITSRVGLRIGKLLIRMGGRQRLPYTHVQNCAEAIALAGLTVGIDGEAFNIVDDDPPTANQLVRRYRRHVGKLRTIRIPHFGIVPLSQMCQWYNGYSHGQLPAILTPYKSAAIWTPIRFSNAKAKRMLSWQPGIDFNRGLESTFAAMRQQNRSRRTSE